MTPEQDAASMAWPPLLARCTHRLAGGPLICEEIGPHRTHVYRAGLADEAGEVDGSYR